MKIGAPPIPSEDRSTPPYLAKIGGFPLPGVPLLPSEDRGTPPRTVGLAVVVMLVI